LTKAQIKQSVKLLPEFLESLPQVAFCYLHGSILVFEKGELNLMPRDIDIAIYVTKGDYLKVELDLQLKFHRATGFPPEILDVRTLNEAPLEAAIEVITKGKLIFCRDELLHANYVEEVSNTYRQLAGLIEETYV